ncbi:hypothetical protein BDZ94DRAFT_1135638, partial [Collybia nuda]
MARSQHSPSHSPAPAMSPSPSFSDSEARLSPPSESQETLGPSVSQAGSPSELRQRVPLPEDVEEDSVTCLWDDCGIVFTHLPTLIDHIHNDHIGVHKSNYTCEWATCPRRGLAQTSRFALISHIRSHTGEKPFTCQLPECDKSFTRSDALAKHMRLQHGIEPPAPGRGGARKRKRGLEEPVAPSRGHSPPTVSTSNGAFNTFKIEPSPYPEALNGSLARDRPDAQHTVNGHRSLSPISPRLRRRPHASSDQDEGYNSSASDTLPAHLMEHYVPATNLILGRSPSMVMYLLMKAKHRYALEQHESLLEELRVAKAELRREKDEKELALDELLRGYFGPQAEQFITPIPPPILPEQH